MVSLADLNRRQIGKAEDIGRNRTVTEVMDNGVFRAYSNGTTVLRRRITKFSDQANLGAGNGVEGIELKIPKIPFKYWLMALDYYKDVHKRDHTEVSVLFYYNVNGVTIPEDLRSKNEDGMIEDGDLLIYCPTQINTSTHSNFKDDELFQWLEDNYQCVVETHSHHTMDAFFSGTDDANEKQPRCYGVYGKINTHDKFLLRFYLAGKHIMIKPTDLFDIPVLHKQEQVIKTAKIGYYDGDTFVSLEELESNKEQETVYTGVYPNNHTYPETWMDRTRKEGDRVIAIHSKTTEVLDWDEFNESTDKELNEAMDELKKDVDEDSLVEDVMDDIDTTDDVTNDLLYEDEEDESDNEESTVYGAIEEDETVVDNHSDSEDMDNPLREEQKERKSFDPIAAKARGYLNSLN